MLSKSEAKEKAARYCAYQERSQKQVRSKLYDIGLYGNDAEEIIAELIRENFINEERFARLYTGGKFRIKKWGKIKIQQGLAQQDISPYCIKKGMEEIDDNEYKQALTEHILKKKNQLKEDNIYLSKQKVARYAIGKGFEPDLVWTTISDLNV